MKSLLKNVLLVFSLIIFITSCSENIITEVPSVDQIEIPVNINPVFTDIQKEIFNTSCALNGCHAGAVNPNLSEGNAYNNIVNKPSSNGIPYIKPNEPDNSYLLQKVLGSSIISGSRMPLNNSPLDKVQITALTEWINDGAKNN